MGKHTASAMEDALEEGGLPLGITSFGAASHRKRYHGEADDYQLPPLK